MYSDGIKIFKCNFSNRAFCFFVTFLAKLIITMIKTIDYLSQVKKDSLCTQEKKNQKLKTYEKENSGRIFQIAAWEIIHGFD